jgi:ribonuclease BN (tRNA processing enzyme)
MLEAGELGQVPLKLRAGIGIAQLIVMKLGTPSLVQYAGRQYEMRIGWGHSSVADAVAFTRAVGARRLVLFHHEPRHDDGSLERLETRAQSLAGRNRAEVMLAREGMVVELP